MDPPVPSSQHSPTHGDAAVSLRWPNNEVHVFHRRLRGDAERAMAQRHVRGPGARGRPGRREIAVSRGSHGEIAVRYY